MFTYCSYSRSCINRPNGIFQAIIRLGNGSLTQDMNAEPWSRVPRGATAFWSMGGPGGRADVSLLVRGPGGRNALWSGSIGDTMAASNRRTVGLHDMAMGVLGELGGSPERRCAGRTVRVINRRYDCWRGEGSMPQPRHGRGDPTGARSGPPWQDGAVLQHTSCGTRYRCQGPCRSAAGERAARCRRRGS